MSARCCGPCGDHLHCRVFGPSGCERGRVKWPWQPVASSWPSQASIASGSGSSAYSPTSRRPHVDEGWGSCRQTFGEIKTWPNFLQSMSEKGDEAFLCFPPLLLHPCCPGAGGAACLPESTSSLALAPSSRVPCSTARLPATPEVAAVQKLTRTPLVEEISAGVKLVFHLNSTRAIFFKHCQK